MNKSGGAVAECRSPPQKIEGKTDRRGWPDFADCNRITHADVLNNGSLTVEVRMKPDEDDVCRNFIPKNPFVRNMLLSFLDEETADTSFELETRSLINASKNISPALGEVFHAHKFVLKTCAKGSILAFLCDDCDDETPVPITDVAPKVFRLMLRYVYGGDILAVEWITPKICLKPRTNMA